MTSSIIYYYLIPKLRSFTPNLKKLIAIHRALAENRIYLSSISISPLLTIIHVIILQYELSHPSIATVVDATATVATEAIAAIDAPAMVGFEPTKH